MMYQLLLLMPLFFTAGASKREQCLNDASQELAAQGSKLLQLPAEADGQARKKKDMKTVKDDGENDIEEDLDEFADMLEEIAEEGCPSFCNKKRFTKLPWDEKCWTWACQKCSSWKKNCQQVER